MSGGRRDVKTDDKTFIADIARSFHVDKALQKASRVEKKNNSSSSAARHVDPQSGGLKKKRRAAKKTGGSVSIVFKGGFSAVPIVSSPGDATLAAMAIYRGQLAERLVTKGVAGAAAYMESAREQAAAAGLHYTGESAAHAKLASSVSEGAAVDYTDGDKYMREQKAIAVRPLERLHKAPVGAHVAALVGSSSAFSRDEAPIDAPAFADKKARDAFDDALVAQKALLEGTSASGVSTETDVVRAPLYFKVGQAQDSLMAASSSGATAASSAGAVVKGNTICIVRSKVSGAPSGATNKARKRREERGKKGTLMFRTKAKADAFVQNFMNNVVRKEMSSAMRIRDGTGMVAAEPSPSSTPAAANSNNASASKSGANGNGKKGRR